MFYKHKNESLSVFKKKRKIEIINDTVHSARIFINPRVPADEVQRGRKFSLKSAARPRGRTKFDHRGHLSKAASIASAAHRGQSRGITVDNCRGTRWPTPLKIEENAILN